jgi:hypothetical protein
MNAKEIDDYLPVCLKQIERKLGWGDASNWTHQDFERLSILLAESTRIKLSAATLKRLWGNLKYTSRPSTTTLDTLTIFIGYENWRSFVSHTGKTSSGSLSNLVPIQSYRPVLGLVVLIVLIASGYFLFQPPKQFLSTDEQVFFQTRKMLHAGVPNSVIFEYDLSHFPEDLPLFIQQSWDPKRKQKISAKSSFHTSMYDFPGFFMAKLVAEDQVLKEQPLLIKSDGWQPILELDPLIYLDSDPIKKPGYLGLDQAQLQPYLQDQKDIPWISFHLVEEFEGITTAGFRFQTRLKNGFERGDNPCQQMEVHLLFEGGAIMIPLSQPGCVSQLNFVDAEGPLEPSKLGVDTNNWVELDFEIQSKTGILKINGQHAYDVSYPYPQKQFVGLRYRFKGSGQVDSYQISNSNSKQAYGEDFTRYRELALNQNH